MPEIFSCLCFLPYDWFLLNNTQVKIISPYCRDCSHCSNILDDLVIDSSGHSVLHGTVHAALAVIAVK